MNNWRQILSWNVNLDFNIPKKLWYGKFQTVVRYDVEEDSFKAKLPIDLTPSQTAVALSELSEGNEIDLDEIRTLLDENDLFAMGVEELGSELYRADGEERWGVIGTNLKAVKDAYWQALRDFDTSNEDEDEIEDEGW